MDERNTVESLGGSLMDLRVGIGTVNLGVDEEELVDLLRDQEDTEKGREVLMVEAQEEEEDQAALMIETLTRSHRTEVIEVIEANEEEEEEVVISEEGVHTVESEVKEEVDIKARFPLSLSCSRYTTRILAYPFSPL